MNYLVYTQYYKWASRGVCVCMCVCACADTCLSAHCLHKAMSPKYLLAVSLSGDILVTCTFSLYFSELHFPYLLYIDA